MGQHRCDDIIHCCDRKRNRGDDEAGPASVRCKIQGIATGVIRMIRGEDFIPGLKIKGSQYSVDARCRVGNTGKIVWRRADEMSECRSRFIMQTFVLAKEKSDGLTFQASPQLILLFKDRTGTGTVGSMIQKRDGRVQSPKWFYPRGMRRRKTVGHHALPFECDGIGSWPKSSVAEGWMSRKRGVCSARRFSLRDPG